MVGEIKWKSTKKVFLMEGLPRLLHSNISPVKEIAFSIAKSKYDGNREIKIKNRK
jgi:hypothetical protein